MVNKIFQKNIGGCMYSILIVDDDSSSIKTFGNILSPYYKVRAASSVENAFKVLEKFNNIELILLDIIMPFITGYEMLEDLKNDEKYKDIPVILVSGLDDVTDEYRGFELGAIDYIQKPILPSVLLARVNTHINTSLERKKLITQINKLEDVSVDNSPSAIFKEVVFLATTYLTRTINDSFFTDSKTQKYLKTLATCLLNDKIYDFELSNKLIDEMCMSVPLYDIGIIGIHDEVLLKEGKYTDADYTEMKSHTRLGYESLEYAISKINVDIKDVDFIETAIDMAHYHHEWWNGTGYPEQLEGYEIPLSARLISIIDVFDALTSDRTYRKKMSCEESKKIIIRGSGTQFDPKIVDAFIKCFDKIVKISKGLT